MDKLDINGNQLLAGSRKVSLLEAGVACGSSGMGRRGNAESPVPSTELPRLSWRDNCQSRDDATVESVRCLEHKNRPQHCRWSLFGEGSYGTPLELGKGLSGVEIAARKSSFSVAVRQRHHSSPVSARESSSLDESEDCQAKDAVVERVSGLNSEDCLQYWGGGLLGQAEYEVLLSAKTSEDAQERSPGPRIAAKTSSFSTTMRQCHQSSQVPALSTGSSPLNAGQGYQCTDAAVDSTGGLNNEYYLADTPDSSTPPPSCRPSPKTSAGPFSEGDGNFSPPLESAGWLFGILTHLTQKIASGYEMLSSTLQGCSGQPPEREHYFGHTDFLVDKG